MPKRSPNTTDTEYGKSWRGVQRDIARFLLFLASNLLMFVTPVFGVPLPTSKDNFTSSNTTAPSISSTRATRDSPFQVIADGTQDIAALVGLFATDSVERRAFDFGRGYLAAAVSNLSLLGMLGYVRLLVKLGLGVSGCQRAGLDTKVFRPMCGIQDDDNIPAEAVKDLYYVQSQSSNKGWVTWKIIKKFSHTKESFPLHRLGKFDLFERTDEDHFVVSVWLKAAVFGRAMNHFTHTAMLLFLSVACSGLTCFSIMIFAGSAVYQPWTYYHATFGLFSLLTASNLVGIWVHFQEYCPHGSFRTNNTKYCGLHTGPPAFKDGFALSCFEGQHHIYEVVIMEKRMRKALSIASLSVSSLIVLG